MRKKLLWDAALRGEIIFLNMRSGAFFLGKKKIKIKKKISGKARANAITYRDGFSLSFVFYPTAYLNTTRSLYSFCEFYVCVCVPKMAKINE